MADELCFERYTDAVRSNFNGLIPVAIGQADSAINAFANGDENLEKLSSFKMVSLAWSGLRTATIIANMGSVLHVPPVHRQALESIGYAHLFACDDEFHSLWKRRHEDEKSKTKFRRDGWKRTMETLRLSNADLHERIASLYEFLIDVGAHPNVLVVEQSMELELASGAETGKAILSMLLGQPHIAQSHAITFELYIILIDLLTILWPQRSENVGLQDKKNKAIFSGVEFLNNLQRRYNRDT